MKIKFCVFGHRFLNPLGLLSFVECCWNLILMSDLNLETAYGPTLFLIKYNTHLKGANFKCIPIKRDLANLTPI